MHTVTRLSFVRPLLLALCAAVVLAGPLASQYSRRIQFRVIADTTIVQEVQLRDGTKLLGRIVGLLDDEVSFTTLGGLDLQFMRRDVEHIREIRGVRRGLQFWPEDPSNTRLFVAPTARVARSGHGYFGVYELVIPSFGVGLGDFAMVSGGFSIIPGIDIDEQVFYFSPKVQVVNTRYVQGAVGVFWVRPGSSDESAGLVYSSLTAGDMTASFSGGLAFPFYSDGGLQDQPVLMLGGEVRASRGVKLITENWIAPGEGDALLSFGVRIIGSRLTVEAAAITSSDGGFAPLVNFSLAW